MQENERGFADKRELENKAPGIVKVLGAVFFDSGLLGIFWFIGMILATAIWTLWQYFSHAGQIPNSKPDQFALMLISIPALYLSILAVWAIRGQQLHLPEIARPKKQMLLFAIGTGLALCVFTMLSTYVVNTAGLRLQPSNQTLLEDTGKQWPIIISIFAIVIAPIFEELFFRKQIFARCVRAGYVITAYLLSSLLFALMHEPMPTQGMLRWLLMLGLYGSIGAVLAWVYRKTGRLWLAMVAHASNNLFAMSMLLISSSMSSV
ncbi:MAG: type II CAAX endopeptidase family protein [Arenimonas sp.]